MPVTKTISAGYILPSAAFTIEPKQIKQYVFEDRVPQVGDLVYGKVILKGQHEDLENKHGRIHSLNTDTKAVFVMGNRYAPDYYEGFIPEHTEGTLDLLARSGVVGQVKVRNEAIAEPTKIKFLGYIVDDNGNVLNTRDFPLFAPVATEKKPDRSKMIVVVGTSMNAGKSYAAATICWSLASQGKEVRASKITGTASLKDILRMEDAGAKIVNDFTYLGWPSTYMSSEEELMSIFDRIDLKYANSPDKFWVVEIADGLLQREVAILLKNEAFRKRIDKLVFAGRDSLSVLGGLEFMKAQYGLIPDAISGVCTGSPLFINEFRSYTDIPVFDNMRWNGKSSKEIVDLLIH